jgi:hypothetical protein
VWLAGTLITLGDSLAVHRYFDRAPELELVRHLCNAVAHGSRFHFRRGEPRFPAHNRLGWVRESDSDFEVTEQLRGTTVLFEFMDAGDVLDVLRSVGVYLIRMGNGDPLRPEPT